MSGVVAVDCLAHVMRRDLPLASERHSAPKYDVTAEQYLALLDEYGVSHGVLTAPSFYGTDNSLLLQALAISAGRLRGTAIVDPAISEEALRELGEGGIVGIRLNWIKRAVLPDDAAPSYRRLFARVRDLGWHIEVYLEGDKLATVLPRLRSHGAPVVVDHFGAPSPDKGVRCAGFREVLRGVAAGDTYVKLSAPYRLGGADPSPYADALLAAANANNLVWATDWPFVGFEGSVSYAQCVSWRDQWITDPAARRLILATTPARLFGFATHQE
ncbi:MAG TPA: amidohydrolase family protein [Casimicrobiaceae bacterium]|nr:amidohydrolase family protein [Casimicrobiaceae bacterium]